MYNADSLVTMTRKLLMEANEQNEKMLWAGITFACYKHVTSSELGLILK